jgi:hypothetical protein
MVGTFACELQVYDRPWLSAILLVDGGLAVGDPLGYLPPHAFPRQVCSMGTLAGVFIRRFCLRRSRVHTSTVPLLARYACRDV